MRTIRLQRGFTLVETMVSMLVLLVGLLGMASVQINAVSKARSSFETSEAVLVITELGERMRGNLPAARNGGYNVVFGADDDEDDDALVPNCHGIAANCAPAQVAAADIARWQSGLRRLLNNASGSINVVVVDGEARQARVQVRWRGNTIDTMLPLE